MGTRGGKSWQTEYRRILAISQIIRFGINIPSSMQQTKLALEIGLAQIRVHDWLSRKLKSFIFVRIEFAEGLDYLHLKKYR